MGSSSDGKARVINTSSNAADYTTKIDLDSARDGPQRKKMSRFDLYSQSKLVGPNFCAGHVQMLTELVISNIRAMSSFPMSLPSVTVIKESFHTPSILVSLSHPVQAVLPIANIMLVRCHQDRPSATYAIHLPYARCTFSLGWNSWRSRRDYLHCFCRDGCFIPSNSGRLHSCGQAHHPKPSTQTGHTISHGPEFGKCLRVL